MKEFFESFPVLVISIIATITGGTAVNKVVQEIKSTTPNNEQKVVEVKRVETTPSVLQQVTPQKQDEILLPTKYQSEISRSTLLNHNSR